MTRKIFLSYDSNIKEDHLRVEKFQLNRRSNSLFAKNLSGFIEQTEYVIVMEMLAYL